MNQTKSQLLNNPLNHIRKSSQSNGKKVYGGTRLTQFHQIYENNIIGTAGPYGQIIKFTLSKKQALCDDLTLKFTVDALVQAGGTYVRFADNMWNILHQVEGVHIEDTQTGRVLERRRPDEQKIMMEYSLENEKLADEESSVVANLTDGARDTLAGGQQVVYLRLKNYFSMLNKRLLMNREFSIVFTIANSETACIQTDGTVSSGLQFSKFELIADYIMFDDHMKVHYGNIYRTKGWKYRVKKVDRSQNVLVSGSQSYSTVIKQLENTVHCNAIVFQIRPQSEISAGKYDGNIAVTNQYYLEEDNEKMISKTPFDDGTYKNVYLRTMKAKNRNNLKVDNVYIFSFVDDISRQFDMSDETHEREIMGGISLRDVNYQLTTTFSGNLSGNHQLLVHNFHEDILIFKNNRYTLI